MADENTRVGVRALAQATYDKAWAYGTFAMYYGAVPLALYLAAKRRDLAWSDIAKAAVRLPFA